MLSLQRTRRGFTLVEMLVVIVIITTLAAIIVPAVFISIGRAKQAKIGLEVANLAKALERYKLEFGEYPPDFSSAAILTDSTARRLEAKRLIDEHLATIYRRRNTAMDLPRQISDPNMVDGAVLELLDPSTALVFWLQGMSPNPQFPIAGDGDRSPFMDFDKGRFINAVESGVATGNPNLVRARMYMAGYYPSGDPLKKPYLYYAAASYASSAANPNLLPAVAWANNPNKPLGLVAPPYISSTLLSFAEPERYQIISAGLDGEYGTISGDQDPSRIENYPVVPSGDNVDELHKDNITNFSGGTISDMLD